MKVSLFKSASFFALLAITTSGAMAVPSSDTVRAIVDGQKFTYADIMKEKSGLPKQYQSEPDSKLFPALEDQVIGAFVVFKAAKADGFENNPEVKKSIEKAVEGIVSQAYLLEKVKGKITDASLKEKYDEIVKKFPEEKEAHLRHILVSDKETAQSIIKALKNGTDFKKLAQSKSKDGTAKDGGDLGYMRKSELPQELADAAFALAPGAYSSEPVKSDFGWHVLKVEEIRDAKPPKFDEIKNELKALMTQEAIMGTIKDLRSKSKIELFDENGKPVVEEKKEAPKAEEKKS
jgi:peptidyl-prolyl cis-trans isomerase C